MAEELADYLNGLTAAPTVVPSTDFVYVRRSGGEERKMSIATMRQVTAGGDVASATTTNLSGAGGTDTTITGTTQIEGFIVTEGEELTVTFADSLPLKYDETNLPMLQSDADITTLPGDKAILVGGAGDVGYIKQYIRKSGVFVHSAVFRCRTISAEGQNVTIATGLNNGDTLNGVTLATNDIIFLPWQTDAAENGIYVVGASPARHPAFATFNSFQNTFIKITEGDQDANSIWLCSSSPGGTIDTDDLDFELIVGRIGSQLGLAEFVKLINTGLYMKAFSGDYYTLVRMGDAQTAARSLLVYCGDTDRSLTLANDFNTLQSCEALLASVEVETDVGTKQTLYTVPTGKRCVVTKVIVKDASTSLAAIGDALYFGFDGGATDFGSIGGGDLTQLVDDSVVLGFSKIKEASPLTWKMGVATNVFGCLFNDTSITGGTLQIDVFGYLYDA